ncbi:Copiatype Polyprotein [Phytophthora palmivora]|uniref:Copiatype Polyprotein n=1 Tax=Phytophthora palmivora TaxID=4796 RepID=A0A2P4YVN1_9STRA|nr:Copiatype Polyprotein [Phytophthora palmivora]
MVDRSHKTLRGMLKSMMKESGLPTSFWNRAYSNAINGIPYEAMWNRTPDIHHLQKLGALAYVHIKDSYLDTGRNSSDAEYIFLLKEQSNTVPKSL